MRVLGQELTRRVVHPVSLLEEGVIPLTAADSDFPAPEPVRAALARVLHTGYLNYAPAAGLPEFREAAAAHYAARDGIQLSAERIVAVDSAASGSFAPFAMRRSMMFSAIASTR